MPLSDLSMLGARIIQRRKLEDAKSDARFLGLCSAVFAAMGGGEFRPEIFFGSLSDDSTNESGGIEDEALMEKALMGWAAAADSVRKRMTKSETGD